MRIIVILMFCLSAIAQTPPPPLPSLSAVTNTVTLSPNYIHLPALSPMKYMLISWSPSLSPNVREYEVDLFPTPTSTNAELVIVTTGTNAVIDLQQYPVGFPVVTAINLQGIRSVMQR
jgi:hypothetical protein